MVVNLISGPRNVSTALMYSFAQRSDTKVVDEPFYGYYLETVGADHPDKEDVIASMEGDFQSIILDIHDLQQYHAHIFLKNMAHHLYNSPIAFMEDFTNVFFIRHPKELITSFAKVIEQPTMRDIGVKQQTILFKQLKQSGKHLPLVVDSAQLIKNPKALLTKLCNTLGLDFTPKMLSWEEGGIVEDGVWAKHWYANVHNSTGFKPASGAKTNLPAHCEALYNDALPYYYELAKFSIKV
ncbi:MAG: sulfotransferase family protein [Cytophagales bacterium]|nr:sulfotransferase family protein [Cytophagales bacterium]